MWYYLPKEDCYYSTNSDSQRQKNFVISFQTLDISQYPTLFSQTSPQYSKQERESYAGKSMENSQLDQQIRKSG